MRGFPLSKQARLGPSDSTSLREGDISAGISGALSVWVKMTCIFIIGGVGKFIRFATFKAIGSVTPGTSWYFASCLQGKAM